MAREVMLKKVIHSIYPWVEQMYALSANQTTIKVNEPKIENDNFVGQNEKVHMPAEITLKSNKL